MFTEAGEMIILGVYSAHDAGAVLFDDYRMISAVALERVTRVKGGGQRFPDEACGLQTASARDMWESPRWCPV